MELDLTKIKSLVEKVMRDNHYRGYEMLDPQKNGKVPPAANQKPDSQLDSWTAGDLMVLSKDGKIITWFLQDNNTNVRDMLAQIIYDVLTDSDASTDISLLSKSGSKLVLGDLTIKQGDHAGTGSKIPGNGNVDIKVSMTKSVSLSQGPLNKIYIDALGAKIQYGTYTINLGPTGATITVGGTSMIISETGVDII